MTKKRIIQTERVYESFFKTGPLARSTIQACRLPKEALVEIECVALAD